MSSKALFIVEGERREREVISTMMQRWKALSGLDFDIFSVCCNIHQLYRELKNEDFLLDITSVIREMKGVSAEDKQILKKGPFTYTYLVFDADLQHYDLSIEGNLEKGLQELEEMTEFFSDETDGTVGKIMISYPMIEAFRDCSTYFDEAYKSRMVDLADCINYKKLVGERGLKKNLSKFTSSDMNDLMMQNLYKANEIVRRVWEKPLYSTFLNELQHGQIMNSEKVLALTNNKLSIFCGLLLFPIDYLGNQDGFYDSLHIGR